ncbi:hypothetical protein C8Q77DRAFT_804557 [Trametes polyzona]|nr:hypothetical protein C8Q77DRAFT_804557 [Trametes polyzona]
MSVHCPVDTGNSVRRLSPVGDNGDTRSVLRIPEPLPPMQCYPASPNDNSLAIRPCYSTTVISVSGSCASGVFVPCEYASGGFGTYCTRETCDSGADDESLISAVLTPTEDVTRKYHKNISYIYSGERREATAMRYTRTRRRTRGEGSIQLGREN